MNSPTPASLLPLIKEGKDSDGDTVLSLVVDNLTVFAVAATNGRWALCFGLTSEIESNNARWTETLTGRGAFATIRLIRPAVEALVMEIDLRQQDWVVYCDARRAKLYSRYLPPGRINIIG